MGEEIVHEQPTGGSRTCCWIVGCAVAALLAAVLVFGLATGWFYAREAKPEALPPVQETPDLAPGATPGGAQVSELPPPEGSEPGEEIVAPADIVFVWVPGGSFLMGSTEEDIEYAVEELEATASLMEHEQPAHDVIIPGFWISRLAITTAQWVEVMGEPPIYKQDGDDHPAIYVSWDDVQDFCEKLDVRLPTEAAEWEYAARGPESLRFPWGDEWDLQACCWDNRRQRNDQGTCPVGSFPSGESWCGALDMSGNAMEWCGDYYDEDYYARSPETDPTGPTSGDRRVVRGGAWRTTPRNCRAAFRYDLPPDHRGDSSGFRVAVSPG